MKAKIERFDVGPILGAVSTESARLWGRGHGPRNGGLRRMFGAARFRKKGRDFGPAQYFKLNPNFDLTGVTVLHPLTAQTDYEYQIGGFQADLEFEDLTAFDDPRSESELDWRDAHGASFRTATSDPEVPRSFIFGSCRYLLRLFGGSWFDDRGDKVFRSILAQIENGRPIDKLLMLGDQIYADDLNFLFPDQGVDEYLSRYREVFSQKYFSDLVSHTPTYMTLDDHEIEDNWPARATTQDFMRKFPAAMHAYLTYQLSHSPVFPYDAAGRLIQPPGRYWYQFEDGCCEFFVMDTRTERLYSDEGERIQVIGHNQMHALKNWLADGSERVKLVATSIPFFPDLAGPGKDRWDSFPNQRNEILTHIRENRVRRVVFLSGDVHSSMTAELRHPEDPEFKIVSVVSSPFFWPYPHGFASGFQTSGVLLHSPGFRLRRAAPVHSTDNFARVGVSPDQIRVEFFARKGERLGSPKTHRF